MGTELEMFSSFPTQKINKKKFHKPNNFGKKLRFQLNRSSNYMYKENFASFLKKIAQNILQSSKKEQKIVCSLGQK